MWSLERSLAVAIVVTGCSNDLPPPTPASASNRPAPSASSASTGTPWPVPATVIDVSVRGGRSDFFRHLHYDRATRTLHVHDSDPFASGSESAARVIERDLVLSPAQDDALTTRLNALSLDDSVVRQARCAPGGCHSMVFASAPPIRIEHAPSVSSVLDLLSSFSPELRALDAVPGKPAPPTSTSAPSPSSASSTSQLPSALGVVGHGHGSVTTHTPSAPEDGARYQRECTLGQASACHAAALDAYYAPSSPETDARARRHFERGCNLGYAPSCNGLGVLFANGRGVARDEARAAALYRRACADGASTACEHLGDALERGVGVPRDPSRAASARARHVCLSSNRDGGACPPLRP